MEGVCEAMTELEGSRLEANQKGYRAGSTNMQSRCYFAKMRAVEDHVIGVWVGCLGWHEAWSKVKV